MADQKLMKYFKFDEADLQANRDGNFSNAQKKRLSAGQANYNIRMGFMVGGALIISLGMLGWMVYLIVNELEGGNSDNGTIFWLGLCGVPLLIVALFFSRGFFMRDTYKFAKMFAKIEGPVSVESYRLTYHAAGTLHYSLHVGDREFTKNINQDIQNVVAKGDLYTFYYCYEPNNDPDLARATYEILSAELISKAK